MAINIHLILAATMNFTGPGKLINHFYVSIHLVSNNIPLKEKLDQSVKIRKHLFTTVFGKQLLCIYDILLLAKVAACVAVNLT